MDVWQTTTVLLKPSEPEIKTEFSLLLQTLPRCFHPLTLCARCQLPFKPFQAPGCFINRNKLCLGISGDSGCQQTCWSVCAYKLLQPCLTLGDPMDCRLLASVRGVSRQEHWSGSPFLRQGVLPARSQTPVSWVSSVCRRFFTTLPPRKLEWEGSGRERKEDVRERGRGSHNRLNLGTGRLLLDWRACALELGSSGVFFNVKPYRPQISIWLTNFNKKKKDWI